MDRYNDGYAPVGHQRDFVLSINEFAHVQNKTDGGIKCMVGPYQTSLSQQDALVFFNAKTKRFEERSDYEQAKQLFTSAPENWYVVLKNPTKSGSHPEAGSSSKAPTDMEIGKKVNIRGPVSFALWPGQMATVVQGHRLRSNQYLLARVYDADSANLSLPASKNEEESPQKYVNGQLLVIKGTDVPFYIPPTGIEVIPVGGAKGNTYVREAVTLERLEYCILKDEDGNKRYTHGPAVVFPEPTETFVATSRGGVCFRAIELSKISGIYVKVIAPYKDDNGTEHNIGEELFITGDTQMIYYPRPEHAIINYDGKYMHHAIAIPKGEGRYVMDRMTGEISMVRGPQMFLPDPRTQVIIKRKLTRNQCKLWYPGNETVIRYNEELTEKKVERDTQFSNSIVKAATVCTDSAAMDILESNAAIARGTSYSKPRTITLDNKFDGVVSINVWPGYAICVSSKTGIRKVITGPQLYLLEYDEELIPITEPNGNQTVYLNLENYTVTDFVSGTTIDNIDTQAKVKYLVKFSKDNQDKWFESTNIADTVRSHFHTVVRNLITERSVLEMSSDYNDAFMDEILDTGDDLLDEYGISISGEVLQVSFDSEINRNIQNMYETVAKSEVNLNLAKSNYEKEKEAAEYIKKVAQLKIEQAKANLEIETTARLNKIAAEKQIADTDMARKAAAAKAQQDLEELQNTVASIKLAQEKKRAQFEMEGRRREAELEKAKQDAYAETVQKIMSSISPDLIAAMNDSANATMMESLTSNMSPWALAKNESVADVTNKLLRGTPLEGVIDKMVNNLAK